MSTKSFWLLHNLSTSLHKSVDDAIKERVGVGLAQYKVLEAIQYKGIAKQNELASMLRQTEAGISRQVKLLYKKGLLVYTNKSRSGGSDVTLTRIGEEVVRLAYQVVDGYTAVIESVVSPGQLLGMQETLEKMTEIAYTQEDEEN